MTSHRSPFLSQAFQNSPGPKVSTFSKNRRRRRPVSTYAMNSVRDSEEISLLTVISPLRKTTTTNLSFYAQAPFPVTRTSRFVTGTPLRPPLPRRLDARMRETHREMGAILHTVMGGDCMLAWPTSQRGVFSTCHSPISTSKDS
jgi:hypothetical protein